MTSELSCRDSFLHPLPHYLEFEQAMDICKAKTITLAASLYSLHLEFYHFT